MTRDEFNTEYQKFFARAIQLSERAKREGMLALEKLIDQEELKKRDILEYGLQLVIDKTDFSLMEKTLLNIIKQEKDKYTRVLMLIKEMIVIIIYGSDGEFDIARLLNSLSTDIETKGDTFLETMEESLDRTHARGKNIVKKILERE
jgi:flagellar motor component MotA